MRLYTLLITTIITSNILAADAVTSATKKAYRDARKELRTMAKNVCFPDFMSCQKQNDVNNIIIKSSALIKMQSSERLKSKHTKTFLKAIESNREELKKSYDAKKVDLAVNNLIVRVKENVK